MFKKISITTGLILFISIVSLITATLYTTYCYYKVKDREIKAIDNILITASIGTDHILGKSFQDRAKDDTSISQVEDEENIKKLSSFARENGLRYVYTMVMQKGKVYFTCSSATQEELKDKSYDTYFTEYTDASPSLFSAFKTGEITFDETPDKYGHFRSVFVPLKTSDGRIYISGADFEISEVQKRVNQTLKITILMGVGVFVLGLLLSIFIAHLITAPLRDLSGVSDQLSLGNELDKEINITGFKEVVLLSKSLDRLRTSMNFAMKKIKKN